MIPPNHPNYPTSSRKIDESEFTTSTKNVSTSFSKVVTNIIGKKKTTSDAKVNKGIVKRNPGLVQTVLKKYKFFLDAAKSDEAGFKKYVESASKIELAESHDLDEAMDTLCKKYVIDRTMKNIFNIQYDVPREKWNMILANVEPAINAVVNSGDSPMDAFQAHNTFQISLAKNLHAYFPNEVDLFFANM